MYRTDLQTRDKGGAIIAAIAINVGLIAAFLQLSGKVDFTDPQSVIKTFDVTNPPPPPPPPPVVQKDKSPKPKEKEGGSAPKNKKSEATPVVAPKPKVEPQKRNPIPVAPIPRRGVAPTQGAAPVAGPGTGAGGVGNGTGNGAGGNGTGGGGGGGVAVPVSLVRGITSRDYPGQIRQNWPRGAAIFLRLRIEPDGRPSRCDVMRGFGNPAADQLTCNLIMQRGVFRPARDLAGRPISAWFGYKQADY